MTDRLKEGGGPLCSALQRLTGQLTLGPEAEREHKGGEDAHFAGIKVSFWAVCKGSHCSQSPPHAEHPSWSWGGTCKSSLCVCLPPQRQQSSTLAHADDRLPWGLSLVAGTLLPVCVHGAETLDTLTLLSPLFPLSPPPAHLYVVCLLFFSSPFHSLASSQLCALRLFWICVKTVMLKMLLLVELHARFRAHWGKRQDFTCHGELRNLKQQLFSPGIPRSLEFIELFKLTNNKKKHKNNEDQAVPAHCTPLSVGSFALWGGQ